MSQFSVSFHLKSDNVEQCVNMLKSCGLKGYVFPPVNGWISFVCEEEDIDKNKKLIQANTGTLTYYYFAEDFGWGFSIFKCDREVCSYGCQWSGPSFDKYGEIEIDEEGYILESHVVQIDDKKLETDELLELLGNDFTKMNEMKRVLYPESVMEAIEICPSYKFAELIGIENVDWISYGFVSRHTEDYPDAIKV